MQEEVTNRQTDGARAVAWRSTIGRALATVALAVGAGTAEASVSVWEAAEFRVWGFVPYWTTQSQLQSFPADGVYNHVSDVLYFGGVRPTSTGGLNYHSAAMAHLTTLGSHAAQNDFRLHMSMFDVAPGNTVDAVWTSLTSSATYRANFVANVTNLLDTYGMSGFNFDWERPNTVAKWGNYTQLARELGNVIRPLGGEISVCDYGFADSRWDDSPLFDARVYDQLFIMGYHYPASSGNSLNYNSFANGKLNLTDQGAEKAFTDEQLVVGIGTWGTDGPATKGLKAIGAVEPNLAGDASTFTGTVTDFNGTHTGTWTIESRYQVRDKVQFALDRNMPGMMSWTLHYDATNQLSLHRVMHHYLVFQRGIPDVNLDGRVDAADAHALADNMGTVPGWTGTNTAARFDNFYLRGNWEVGDRDGNGFVNQQDADWLAGRFAALGIELPDRLAYTGTFENFADGRGLAGRWQANRDSQGQLAETGNYTQHAAGHLAFTANGPGADKFSAAAVTIRNQNAAERFDALNTQPRLMHVDLAAPIDLGQSPDTYFTFLVRQNTGPLLDTHLTSPNRTLALEFLDADGVNQFDVAFHGLQQQFAIRSQADTAGEDDATGGFGADNTYLVVGRISGNGPGANTLQASLLAGGSTVEDFTQPDFDWMLTAHSSADFNPVIAQLQWRTLYEANYSVGNVWIGAAGDFFESAALPGDFSGNGAVENADLTLLLNHWGAEVPPTPAGWIGAPPTMPAIDNDELTSLLNHWGNALAAGNAATSGANVPEPASLALLGIAVVGLTIVPRQRGGRLTSILPC